MSKPSHDEVAREVVVAIRRMQQANDMIDHAAAQLLGIHRTDLQCLDLLMFDGEMSPSQLARRLGLTTASMTSVIDRLEAAGYAARTRDTDDRRRVLVTVTDDAWRACEPLYGPLAEAGQRELASYTVDQLELIRDFLEHGTTIASNHAQHLRDSQPEA